MKYFQILIALIITFPLTACHNRKPNPSAKANTEKKEIVAFLGNTPIYFSDLKKQLIEAAGGQVLVEVILDNLIKKDLARQGKIITPEDIQKEKKLILTQIHPNVHQAARLFDQFQQSRGIGQVRFAKTLRRNAALRKIIPPIKPITQKDISDRFKLIYGEKKTVRMIVLPDLQKARQILNKLKKGADFATLAANQSIDNPSAQRGGLLSPLSIWDLSYPVAVRLAVSKLKPHQISHAVVVDAGYAIFRCEKINPPQKITLQTVKSKIENQLQHERQAQKMQMKVKQLLANAHIMVNYRPLNLGWKYQMKLMKQQ